MCPLECRIIDLSATSIVLILGCSIQSVCLKYDKWDISTVNCFVANCTYWLTGTEERLKNIEINKKVMTTRNH